MPQVKVNGRFIKRKDWRLLCEPERNCDQLPLPRTQGAHITRRKVCGTDAFKRRRRAIVIVRCWSTRPTPVRETAECHELISTCCKWKCKVCANNCD